MMDDLRKVMVVSYTSTLSYVFTKNNLKVFKISNCRENHNKENQTMPSNYILHMPPGLIFVTELTADRVSSNLPLSWSQSVKSVFFNEIICALETVRWWLLTHQNRQMKLI